LEVKCAVDEDKLGVALVVIDEVVIIVEIALLLVTLVLLIPTLLIIVLLTLLPVVVVDPESMIISTQLQKRSVLVSRDH
jgi:hypothetical protein